MTGRRRSHHPEINLLPNADAPPDVVLDVPAAAEPAVAGPVV